MVRMSSPWLCAALIGASAFVATGCAHKAAWVPNNRGGYTLSTTCHHMDDAMVRFRRTAEDLCGENRYSIGEAQVISRGWGFGRYGGGTEMTVQTDLTCQR